MEIGILVIFFVDIFQLPASKFNKFDTGNMILSEIKVFARNFKETTLARYFRKVTTRTSFTQLRVIRRINRIHLI